MCNNELMITENTSLEERKRIYKLITNAEEKVSSKAKEVIDISEIYFTYGTYTDENSGELVENCERVLLVDVNGKTYHSMSVGVVSSAHNIIACFGNINEIKDAHIPMLVKPKEVKKGQTYILEPVD